MLFSLPTSFSPLPTRIYCLLYRKATWFINSHATVTVGMYAVLPKGCLTGLNNLSLNLSALALNGNAYFLPVGANLPSRLILSLLLLIQPLDFIFYKILPVFNILMTVDCLFLPEAALLSIYLLLKPLLSKLLTPPSPTKRIRVQIQDCALMMLSHWSFFTQSRLGFFR